MFRVLQTYRWSRGLAARTRQTQLRMEHGRPNSFASEPAAQRTTRRRRCDIRGWLHVAVAPYHSYSGTPGEGETPCWTAPTPSARCTITTSTWTPYSIICRTTDNTMNIRQVSFHRLSCLTSIWRRGQSGGSRQVVRGSPGVLGSILVGKRGSGVREENDFRLTSRTTDHWKYVSKKVTIHSSRTTVQQYNTSMYRLQRFYEF